MMASKRISMVGLGSACALLTFLVVPGKAQVSAQVGILSCDVSSGIGLILSQKQTMSCKFQPASGTPENYTGKIDEYGVDIGNVEQGQLVWGVATASQGYVPGSLAGKYVGVGADASVGVGLGANALVGGNGNAFSLQPLSVEGEAGLNIAAGVLTVTLKAAD